MKRLLVLVFLTMMLWGCDAGNNGFPIGMERIEYAKDKRANICYAMVTYFKGFGLTIVPCEKVEHLINKEKQ